MVGRTGSGLLPYAFGPSLNLGVIVRRTLLEYHSRPKQDKMLMSTFQLQDSKLMVMLNSYVCYFLLYQCLSSFPIYLYRLAYSILGFQNVYITIGIYKNRLSQTYIITPSLMLEIDCLQPYFTMIICLSNMFFSCILSQLCAHCLHDLFFLVCCADCLGRRLGPRLLGRVDDSGVSIMFSRYHKCILNLLLK